ncbi:steryl-sulfatase-like [Glandiceps talaboti]
MALQLAISITVVVALADITTAGIHKPNVVLFLVDDMGLGDVGCYGNETVKTPNIDRLAVEGLKFNRMYSQSTCTPSRTVLLTGRYQIRQGMLRGRLFPLNVLYSTALPGGLAQEEITLAEVFKEHGYTTAIMGKWHLGVGSGGKYLPNKQGFDYFYGTPGSHTEICGGKTGGSHLERPVTLFFLKMTYKLWIAVSVGLLLLKISFLIKWKTILYMLLFTLLIYSIGCYCFKYYTALGSTSVCILARNGEIIEQPYKHENMTLRLTREALNFISTNANSPFFLYQSYLKLHTSVFVSRFFSGKSDSGIYGDALMELDWSIGQIVNHLKQLELDKDTLIIFLSDNGPLMVSLDGVPKPPGHGGSPGIVRNKNGEMIRQRGGKGSAYEGSIHVPGIMRWPGVIPKASQTDALVSLIDIFPTISEILNHSITDRVIDGKSLLSLMKNPQDVPSHHTHLFTYCAVNLPPAMNIGKYKVHFVEPEHDGGCSGEIVENPIVYDLENDPGEQWPLSLTLQERGNIVDEARAALSDHMKTVQPPYFTQLDYFILPWLQPCANFPYCSQESTEEDNFDEILPLPILSCE